MATNKYIGARYVPKIMGAWDNKKSYEPLIIVQHGGNSYTSRKSVPIGIEITNEEYWACTGNYNAQIENYRQETVNAVQTVNKKLDGFSNAQDGKFQIMFNKYKEQITKYTDGKYNDINNDVDSAIEKINQTKAEVNASISEMETTLQTTCDNYTTTVNNQLHQIEEIINTKVNIIYDAGTSTDIEDENITIFEGGIC